MLCRVLLAATVLTCTFSREITVHGHGQGSTNLIQIKDVICVLLLSGLQKGDLDANTLEKLQRHNVNIYDMNNESLRQECLLKSLSDAGKETKTFVITEDPNDPSKRPIHQEPSIGNNVAEIQKSDILAPENYFIDKTNLREIDIKGVIEKEHSNNDNVNEKPSDINVTILQETKDQQIRLIENNPTLEHIMDFWVTFTQNTNTASTKETIITDSPTSIPEKVHTTKSHTSNSDKENQHSRKMNYINKMLAEFLESQTVPTTTQTHKTEATNMDIDTKIKAVLAKNGQLYPINKEDIFGKNTKEINELVEFINIFNKDQKTTSETSVRTPQKINNNDNADMGKSKDIHVGDLHSMDFRSATEDNTSDKKIQALKLLNDMLKVNHKFRLNEPFNTETITQESLSKNVEQEGGEKPKQLGNENNSNRDSEHVKNIIKMTNDPVQIPGRIVSADVIQEIAEKVKAIVMKDIMKEIPTSDTTVPCTTFSTVKPTTPIKETNESVIQALMALFKEYKAIKEPSKTTTHTPLSTSADEKSKHSPSIIDTFNIYGGKPPVANAKQVVINPYNPNFPYPLGQFLPSTMHGPQTNFKQNIENQIRPITIQTNSEEIPPLVIQMPKPMKVMNQHIILTTVKPTVKHTQEHFHHGNSQQFNYLDQNPIYGDLTKKLRIAENVKKEYRESYKDTIEKMKERIKYSPEHTHDQAHENRPFVSDHHVSHSDTNSHDTFNKHSNSNRHDIHNRIEDMNHHENRSPESSYRDIITREFLSRLVDSNHHDIISELVASNHNRPNEKVDLDHRSQSHQSDAYERFEHERSHPRFKGHKFHEKLEGVENRPYNSYESYSKTTKKTCCEAVAAREQVPLSKIKPRPKFDDTHFKNFLKSQQKVTDMLERILAAKTKGKESKTQSNESS